VSAWCVVYERYEPRLEGLREALCTLGNGTFATRGAAPDARADGVHYPGTYLAGGYDRARTVIHGREVENEDLVNLPNWRPSRSDAKGASGSTSTPSRSSSTGRSSTCARASCAERSASAMPDAGRPAGRSRGS